MQRFRYRSHAQLASALRARVSVDRARAPSRAAGQIVPGQGRLGDKANVPLDAHGCPACPHPAIGPAIQGSPNVNVNRRPALRVGDPGIHTACCGTNTWIATKGSLTVFINGKGAHRMGDQNRHCGGMGQLVEGSHNVIVDESGGGGSGGGERSDSGGDDKPSDKMPPIDLDRSEVSTDVLVSAASGRRTGSGRASSQVQSRDGGSKAVDSVVANSSLVVSTATAAEGAFPGNVHAHDPMATLTWIEIRLVGEDGQPIPGERYILRLPSGEQRSGFLDTRGCARLIGLEPGTCTVAFPDLDSDAWEFA